MPDTKQSLSAEVILKSASGKSFSSDTAITSENVAEYLPSREVAEEARRHFIELGFEVSEPAGTGFSITAPASVFDKVFKTKIMTSDEGEVQVKTGGAKPSYELPLGSLAKSVAQHVVAVTFTRPPDYGPGNF